MILVAEGRNTTSPAAPLTVEQQERVAGRALHVIQYGAPPADGESLGPAEQARIVDVVAACRRLPLWERMRLNVNVVRRELDVIERREQWQQMRRANQRRLTE